MMHLQSDTLTYITLDDPENYIITYNSNHTGSVQYNIIYCEPQYGDWLRSKMETMFSSETMDDLRIMCKKNFVKKLEKAVQEADEDRYDFIETIDDLIDLLNNRAKSV